MSLRILMRAAAASCVAIACLVRPADPVAISAVDNIYDPTNGTVSHGKIDRTNQGPLNGSNLPG